MNYRLVSLDMAGTTFDDDNVVYEVLSACVTEASGHELSAHQLEPWTGTSKYAAIVGLLGVVGSAADPQRVYARFTEQLLARYRSAPPLPFAGVPELFRELREAGVRVALQTGYSVPVAQLLLEGAGWQVGRDIDALVSSDEVRASRPAPFLIFHTMEATGVEDVREVLVAGDTPNDLLAGTRAGARYVVGVRSGAHGHEELGRVPHTHLLGSVTEIRELRGVSQARPVGAPCHPGALA